MHQLSERLRAERERQRRTLRDLSAQTKIREPFLAAIERGDFDVLPQVYVRSFVKTYAAALGVPEAHVAPMLAEALERERHDDAPSTHRRQAARESGTQQERGQGSDSAPLPASRSSTERRSMGLKLDRSVLDLMRTLPLWIWVAAGTVVVAIVIGLVISGDDDESATASGPSTVVDVEATAAVRDSMILRAEVQDSAWITITADGKTSYQAILLPGTSAQWSAMERFEISMGNAGGVVFYRNEERLDPFAAPKQSVRKVVVTRTTVVTPSTAWQEQPPAPATSQQSAQPSSSTKPASAKPSERRQRQQEPIREITPVKPR